MKKIRFIEGNDLTLYIPLVLMKTSGATPLEASSLTDIKASLIGCCKSIELTPLASNYSIKVQLPSDLKVGAYSIEVSATYEGRDVRTRIDGSLEVVGNSAQSNWQDYVQEDSATIDTQIFIADSLMTDEEFEQLKAEYVTKIATLDTKIAAAEASKETLDAKAEALTDVAQESMLENSNYGLAALLAAIKAIPGGGGGGGASMDEIQKALDTLKVALQGADADTLTMVYNKVASIVIPTDYAKKTDIPSVPTDYAKETTASAAKTAAEAAQTAAESISIPTDYAKESNATANKAAIIAAIPSVPTDYSTAAQVTQLDLKIGEIDTALTTINSTLEGL